MRMLDFVGRVKQMFCMPSHIWDGGMFTPEDERLHTVKLLVRWLMEDRDRSHFGEAVLLESTIFPVQLSSKWDGRTVCPSRSYWSLSDGWDGCELMAIAPSDTWCVHMFSRNLIWSDPLVNTFIFSSHQVVLDSFSAGWILMMATFMRVTAITCRKMDDTSALCTVLIMATMRPSPHHVSLLFIAPDNLNPVQSFKKQTHEY